MSAPAPPRRAAGGGLATNAWAATVEYSQRNEVGEGLSLTGGFFDCGHGWGSTLTEIGAAALLRLVRKECATGGRELILVDSARDHELRV